jgi:hypothetical protein
MMTDEQDIPKNRAERRAERHRRPIDKPQDNLQPQSRNNRAFGRSNAQPDRGFGTPTGAHTGQPDDEQTERTGPGSGGATETADRTPENEAQPSPQNQSHS